MCGEDEVLVIASGLPIWFIALWLGAVVLAIFSRSLLLIVGLLFLSVIAGIWVQDLSNVSEIVRYSLMAGFYSMAGFAVFQLMYKVRTI